MSDADDPYVAPPRKPGAPENDLHPRKPDSRDTVGAAIGLYVAAAGGAITLTAYFGGFFLMGIAQLFGVIPLLVFAYRKKRYVLVKVTWIAAGILFLLNAACIGAVILALGYMH